ncbi:FAD/FMN-containing dehydrogenase [Pseudomonas sp. N040]|nr:FAD/FMN-containing dehydrogenase [Pseudomonas sp. N040]MBW7013901.1 FAD/FMN-containing dehydrogenase [Pseudomonas sp. N040]
MILLSGLLHAQEAAVVRAPWTLLDQFDQAYTLNDELHILLVARSMDGAKILKQALEGKTKGYLEARNAIFVADVSQMPGLIATLFAIPAMQDYTYRVLLDRQPRVVTRYPGASDTVLWVDLQDGLVKAQREYSDPIELEKALQQAGQ